MRYEKIGYVGSGAFTREDAGKLTGINLAFGELHKNGTVTARGRMDKLMAVSQYRDWNPSLRILLSMVQAEPDAFTRCCADSGLRRKAAWSLGEMVDAYNLDGIDLDWEYPCVPSNGSQVSPDDRRNFTLFCQEIRRVLDSLPGERKKYLTIAAGADLYYVNCVELPELMESLDLIHVMTYDLKCGFHALAGHHTALFSNRGDVFCNSCAQALSLFESRGVPREKLIMGAAFYSRKWTHLPDNENHGLLMLSPHGGGYGPDYQVLEREYINRNGFVEYWDEEAQAPWLFDGSTFLSYDNPRSIQAKADYVKEMGYGGIFYWEHKCDGDRVLLDALCQGLGDE